MLELQAGGGFGGAAKQFYDRHRVVVVSVVLSVVGLATGTAAAMAVLQRFVPLDCLVMAASVVLATGVCFVQTRHFPLAWLTALSPVPGLLWAAPVSGGSRFGVLPVLSYAFSLAVAVLATQARLEHSLGEDGHEHPWSITAVSLALMGVLAVLWFRGTASADAALQAVADGVLSAVSAVILLSLAFSWLHFDESFVARANRARERRSRFFEWVALVTIPRWAFSFTGITIIFLTLGWYGAAPVLRDDVLLTSVSVLLIVVAAGAVAGGWREGLAIGLVTSTIVLIALWATVADSRAPVAAVGVLQVLTLTFLLAISGARCALKMRRQNDPPIIAQRRTLERASGQAFAEIGALAALLPAVAVWTGSVVVGIAVMSAGAAIVLAPAVSTALGVLIPRRRSVEELYGRRKKPTAY
jgi:hypothetical protein